MGALLAFVSLGVFAWAAVGIINPRVARLRGRLHAVGLLALSVALLGVGGAMTPEPSLEVLAERQAAAEDREAARAERAAEREAEQAAREAEKVSGVTFREINDLFGARSSMTELQKDRLWDRTYEGLCVVWMKPENLTFDMRAHLEKQLRAAVSLGAASANSPSLTTDDDIGRIADTVRATTSVGAERDAKWKNHVLWVDDKPDNNRFERLAFEAMGLRFTLAQSTNEGLERLRQDQYAAVISDMGRREGQREGYVLLDRLRDQGNRIPLLFYTSSNAPQHKREALDHGGQGSTNNPHELFEMVTRELLRN